MRIMDAVIILMRVRLIAWQCASDFRSFYWIFEIAKAKCLFDVYGKNFILMPHMTSGPYFREPFVGCAAQFFFTQILLLQKNAFQASTKNKNLAPPLKCILLPQILKPGYGPVWCPYLETNAQFNDRTPRRASTCCDKSTLEDTTHLRDSPIILRSGRSPWLIRSAPFPKTFKVLHFGLNLRFCRFSPIYWRFAFKHINLTRNLMLPWREFAVNGWISSF